MRRPRREPWSFWCILKCSVNEPMRSLSNAICTSGLPVSVAWVPYWSMRVFFCSLASTNLVHSCLIFQLFCNVYEVNTSAEECKGKAGSRQRHRRTEGTEECYPMWEQTMTEKQRVESLLHKLPDNCSLEDIQYHLYVLEKVQRGLDEARIGGTLSQEEAEKRLGKWLTE